MGNRSSNKRHWFLESIGFHLSRDDPWNSPDLSASFMPGGFGYSN